MEAGTVYEFTISIEKPVQFLEITPFLPTSAITLEPPTIVFKDYGKTI